MTGLAASAIEAHQVATGAGHAPSTRCREAPPRCLPGPAAPSW